MKWLGKRYKGLEKFHMSIPILCCILGKLLQISQKWDTSSKHLHAFITNLNKAGSTKYFYNNTWSFCEIFAERDRTSQCQLLLKKLVLMKFTTEILTIIKSCSTSHDLKSLIKTHFNTNISTKSSSIHHRSLSPCSKFDIFCQKKNHLTCSAVINS